MQVPASRVLAAALFLSAASVPSVFGQSVISAQSGVVQYVEGKVLLNDHAIDPKFGQFPAVKNNQILRTEEGRAEILLTPGVFLRMGENSSIRMVSNLLTDTKVEFLSGSALVEAADILKDNAISILYKDRSVQLLKDGLYRFDSAPARVLVYNGEAVLFSGKDRLTLKNGRETDLDGSVLSAEKFNGKSEQSDELYLWSQRRDSYVAMANVASAQTVTSGGSAWSNSGWAFNPFYGMYTYIPLSGVSYSPFGYGFWSPYAAYQMFGSPYGYGYGYGYPYGYGNSGGGGRNSIASVSKGAPGRARMTTQPVRLPTGVSGSRIGASPAMRGGYSRGGYSRGGSVSSGSRGYSGGNYSSGSVGRSSGSYSAPSMSAGPRVGGGGGGASTHR